MRRNENIISKGKEAKKKKAFYLLLCLSQQKGKNSFQRLMSSTPWNKLATYTAKSGDALRSASTPLFVCIKIDLVVRACACLAERSDATCMTKHTPKCQR